MPTHVHPTGSLTDVRVTSHIEPGVEVRRMDAMRAVKVIGTGSRAVTIDRDVLRTEILGAIDIESVWGSGFNGPGLSMQVMTYDFRDVDDIVVRLKSWFASGDWRGVVTIEVTGVPVTI